jgi:hypothetical protein
LRKYAENDKFEGCEAKVLSMLLANVLEANGSGSEELGKIVPRPGQRLQAAELCGDFAVITLAEFQPLGHW